MNKQEDDVMNKQEDDVIKFLDEASSYTQDEMIKAYKRVIAEKFQIPEGARMKHTDFDL